MGSNTTMVVTSCDRHDLLKRTLDSFIQINSGGIKPDRTIIVEDGTVPMPEWLRQDIHYYSSNVGKVEWVQNDTRMGQIYSIDRAYQMVETDYIFHCEDDWEFVRGNGWMQRSKQILEKHPEIFMVSLRGNSGWHPLIDQPPFEGFKIAQPYWRGGWGGIAFNPGLRRLSDYKRIGSYGLHVSYSKGGCQHELALSRKFLDLGYRIADLGETIAVHLGDGRSKATLPPAIMPKVLIAIPVCHKYDYGKWESEFSPLFDPNNAWNNAPYGTDIHISGNGQDRVSALRETWLQDVKTFNEHVDYKLFYGSPHDRPAEPDEVYLGCPDDYEHLPQKTVAICRYALENGYGWLYKCDDDTGVYVDRVIHEMLTNRFDYAGYTQGGVATGGTGYWLSKRAFSIVARHADISHWAEDVTVAKTLFHHNIKPVHLPGHRTGKADHWFFQNGYDASVDMAGVSAFHAVRPQDMREWYAGRLCPQAA